MLMATILRLIMVGLSHYLQGFSTIPGGFLAGFLVAINSYGARFWSSPLQGKLMSPYY